jgi:PKD repeat protein
VHTVDWSASVQVLPANQPPEVDLRVFSLGRGKFRLDATGSVDPEGGALIYTWSVGDGAPSPGEALLERTFSPGTHRVSLSVVDDHGLEVRTAVPLVVSNGAPAVVLKAPKSVVAGTPTAWGATASDPDGDAIVSWQWSFSDGTHASGPKVTHTWPLAGQAWVRVVATDNRGLSGEATKALVVGRPNGPPKVALKAPDGPVAGEAGLWEAVAHDPDGDSIVSWTWSFGGRTATGRSVRHVWPKAGTFDVRVVAVDSHGLAGEATTKVKVLAKNRPPTINSADCDWSGSSITFDVDAVDPDAGDTLEYRWDLGDGRKATTEKGDVAAPSVRHGQMCTVEIRDGRGGTATRTVPLNTVF